MPLMEEEVAASEEVLTDLLEKLSDMVRHPVASGTRKTATDGEQGRDGRYIMQAGPGRATCFESTPGEGASSCVT